MLNSVDDRSAEFLDSFVVNVFAISSRFHGIKPKKEKEVWFRRSECFYSHETAPVRRDLKCVVWASCDAEAHSSVWKRLIRLKQSSSVRNFEQSKKHENHNISNGGRISNMMLLWYYSLLPYVTVKNRAQTNQKSIFLLWLSKKKHRQASIYFEFVYIFFSSSFLGSFRDAQSDMATSTTYPKSEDFDRRSEFQFRNPF